MKNWCVESDFVHNGLRCVVILTSMGHRCGYVGIDKNHPLFNILYSDENKVLNGQSPQCVFDVHGGITYSNNNEVYPVESNLWWFGFDCAHCGDAKDYDTSFKVFKDKEKIITQLNIAKQIDEKYFIEGNVVRTKEYVEQECKNLANQLKDIIK